MAKKKAKDLEEALTNIESKLGGSAKKHMDLGEHLEYIESLISSGGSGTAVEANPEVSGSEPSLNSIKIGDNKYIIPQGGSGSSSLAADLGDVLVELVGEPSETEIEMTMHFTAEQIEKLNAYPAFVRLNIIMEGEEDGTAISFMLMTEGSSSNYSFIYYVEGNMISAVFSYYPNEAQEGATSTLKYQVIPIEGGSSDKSIITTTDFEDVIQVISGMYAGYRDPYSGDFKSLWNQRYAGYLKPSAFSNIWTNIDTTVLNWLATICTTGNQYGYSVILLNGEKVVKTVIDQNNWKFSNSEFELSVQETESDTIVTVIKVPTSLCVLEIITSEPIVE